MEICIRPETCGYDLNRLKKYAGDTGVDYLWYFPSLGDRCGMDGMVDGPKLLNFKEELQKAD